MSSDPFDYIACIICKRPAKATVSQGPVCRDHIDTAHVLCAPEPTHCPCGASVVVDGLCAAHYEQERSEMWK